MRSEGASLVSTAADRYVDPVARRALHRLTTLHALDTDRGALRALHGESSAGVSVADALYLGRLGPYYRQAGPQFPTVLIHEQHHEGFTGHRPTPGLRIERACSWLFHAPNGGLVAGLTLDFESAPRAAIPLLEDAYYDELQVGSRGVVELLQAASETSGLGAALAASRTAAHGHQLFFVAGDQHGLFGSGPAPSTRIIDHDLVRRLIYRFDVPYREDSGAIRFPAELNRNMATLAACGPYVSLFVGQQDYVENAALISAVQLVGSAALLSIARTQAYNALEDLSRLQAEVDDEVDGLSFRPARRRLGKLSETVGRLELDLSFGVEAFHDIGALVPSLRVSNLHSELFEAAALPQQTQSVGQMLDRLARATAAEAASVLADERSQDERRRLTWGVAIGFASFIAIPLTLIFGFFAVATTNVSHRTSLLDVGRYKWFYAVLVGLMLATVVLALLAWLMTRARDD